MIYICTNKETVAEHVEHDSHEVCMDVAEMFLENLGRVMEDTEYDTESSFAAWHGGRMVQHHKVMGLVAYDPEDAAVASQIYDAIHGELVRLVELQSEPLSDDTRSAPSAPVYGCACGEVTGERCCWTGPLSEMVLIEYMPAHLRDSCSAAGNNGIYPANGAIRLAVERTCAELILSTEGEWAQQITDDPQRVAKYAHVEGK